MTTLLFDREGVRAVDRGAIEQFGLPGVVLMENAAHALRDAALDALGGAGSVLILCGPGNNGGDGFALARKLLNDERDVDVVHAVKRDAYSGDARTNLDVLRRMSENVYELDAEHVAETLGRIAGPALVVDALFGTGLTRPPAPPFDEIIRWINEHSDARTLAVDIPSGLDCDSGRPVGQDDTVVRADVTVTFCGWKKGFLGSGAHAYVGNVVVGDIGAPRSLLVKHGRTFQPPW